MCDVITPCLLLLVSKIYSEHTLLLKPKEKPKTTTPPSSSQSVPTVKAKTFEEISHQASQSKKPKTVSTRRKELFRELGLEDSNSSSNFSANRPDPSPPKSPPVKRTASVEKKQTPVSMTR